MCSRERIAEDVRSRPATSPVTRSAPPVTASAIPAATPTVPSLGSGLVMSYGTLSHLGAHTILAASDFAYLVLSLEGPRWVVYGIKGKLGKGEDLPPGTMLNLEQVLKDGEELYYLPVSDEEMKDVVNSVDHELLEVE